MTLDQLRVAFERTFRSYGVTADAEFLDELVSIADHHAAEESAAGAPERHRGLYVAHQSLLIEGTA